MQRAKKKLYIVGIDSVPLWLIRDTCKKYGLRGFKKFFDSGYIHDLESTLPPVTSIAWPSIYTGLGPGKHGVMEFFELDREYTKQLMYYDSDMLEPFWNRLSREGVRSLVVTPPMVLEIKEDKNVDLVTGFPLAPRYSSKALQQAAKRFGFVGEEDIEGEIKEGKMSLEEGTARYKESVQKRASLTKYLIERGDYDLVFVCFTETDRLQHYSLGGGRERALQYNEPILSEISRFLEWLDKRIARDEPDSEIMILSDHGAQPLNKKFLLNTWLIREGYAKLKPGIVEQINRLSSSGQQSGGIHKNIKYQIRERLIHAGANQVYGKMPSALRKLASKSMDLGLVVSSDGKYVRVHDLNFNNFDMKNTKAFGAISTNPVGLIWINDSRFVIPGVSRAERNKIKRRIVAGLKGVKGPGGEKLVKAVYDGDEYYDNTAKFIHPDILILLKEGYGVDTFNFSKGSLFIDPDPILNGDHSQDAMVGFFGNGVDVSKLRNKKPHVYDMAPTILRYFGVGAKNLDGRSLI